LGENDAVVALVPPNRRKCNLAIAIIIGRGKLLVSGSVLDIPKAAAACPRYMRVRVSSRSLDALAIVQGFRPRFIARYLPDSKHGQSAPEQVVVTSQAGIPVAPTFAPTDAISSTASPDDGGADPASAG